MFLLWHPSLTAINLSYTFPILETSATRLVRYYWYLLDIVSGKFHACLHWKALKARYFGSCSDSIIAPLLAGIKMLPTSEYFKVFVQIFKASDMSRSSWDMSFSHVPTEQFEDHVSWVWRNLCSHGSQPFLAAKLMANGRLAPGKFWGILSANKEVLNFGWCPS